MRLVTPLLGLALLAGVPAVAVADEVGTMDVDADWDRDRDREQDRLHEQDMDQLRTHLRDQLRLREQDIAGLDAPLRRYLRLGGEQVHMRTMLQLGVDNECNGVCLQEMVRATNRAMVLGMQDNVATGIVGDCLHDQIRERDRTRARWTDQDLGDRLHLQTQERLRLWEEEQLLLRERERAREMDRLRMRETERAMDRTGDGRGSGRGGR